MPCAQKLIKMREPYCCDTKIIAFKILRDTFYSLYQIINIKLVNIQIVACILQSSGCVHIQINGHTLGNFS